jgi:hypothetical protein
MRRSLIAASGLFFASQLAGCVTHTEPDAFFQLTPESAINRAMQTRQFETKDEKELLSASAAVLQDLGFQVEESVREVGFLRATKERSAREYGQDISRFFVWLLTLVPLALGHQPPIMTPVDLHQQIAAALVARPINREATRQEIRIMFYRVVWKGEGTSGNQQILPGEQRMEMLRDPVIYQQFFAKLSKAVFLEGFTL